MQAVADALRDDPPVGPGPEKLLKDVGVVAGASQEVLRSWLAALYAEVRRLWGSRGDFVHALDFQCFLCAAHNIYPAFDASDVARSLRRHGLRALEVFTGPREELARRGRAVADDDRRPMEKRAASRRVAAAPSAPSQRHSRFHAPAEAPSAGFGSPSAGRGSPFAGRGFPSSSAGRGRRRRQPRRRRRRLGR